MIGTGGGGVSARCAVRAYIYTIYGAGGGEYRGRGCDELAGEAAGRVT